MKKITYLFLFLLTNVTLTFAQFYESFEAAALPSGWIAINGGDTNTWLPINLATSTTISAHSGTYVAGIVYSSTAHNDYLVTPAITVTAGVNDQLSFWARSRDPLYPEVIDVVLSTTTPTASAFTTVLQSGLAPASGTAFYKYKYNLSAYVGQTIYIGFKSTTTDKFVFDIDDVASEPITTCPDITGLVAGGITSSSALLNWDAVSGSVNYEYVIDNSINNPTGSGTSVATNTFTPSSLNPTTLYYFHVRANCDSGGFGAWSTISFTTLCGPISSLPWTENFDTLANVGSGIVPSCWSTVTGTKAWFSGNASSTSYNAPYSAPNYMRIAYSNTIASDLWTPGFNLTAGQSYVFSFYYNTNGTSSSYIGFTGNVLVNTVPLSAGAINLGPFITATQGTSAYTLYSITYVPSTSGTYYFDLNVSSISDPWYLGVDDFKLDVNLSNTTFDESRFYAYPNPVRNILNLNNDKVISSVTIFNILGQEVLTKSINANLSQIDMSHLNSGTYMVKVVSDNQTKTIKVIKE